MPSPRLLVFACLFTVFAAACTQDAKVSIVGIKPKVGPYIGGDPATITGTGFQTPGPQSMKVYFGKREAKHVIIASDTEIRVEPPAGETGQTVDVEVVFDDARTGRLAKAYMYIDPIGKPN